MTDPLRALADALERLKQVADQHHGGVSVTWADVRDMLRMAEQRLSAASPDGEVGREPSGPHDWFRVEVTDRAGQIVAIEDGCLAGRAIGDAEQHTIERAIAHLRGFIGPGDGGDRQAATAGSVPPVLPATGPSGAGEASEPVSDTFAAYVRANIPAGTVISNPEWWIPRLWRVAHAPPMILKPDLPSPTSAGQPPASAEGLSERGTYSCPRCGLDTPHRHDEAADSEVNPTLQALDPDAREYARLRGMAVTDLWCNGFDVHRLSREPHITNLEQQLSAARCERDEAMSILAELLPGPRPWRTESVESKLRTWWNMAKERIRNDSSQSAALAAAQGDAHKLTRMADRMLGEHDAPRDCYSTGPFTGDPIADHTCPSCDYKAYRALSASAAEPGVQNG